MLKCNDILLILPIHLKLSIFLKLNIFTRVLSLLLLLGKGLLKESFEGSISELLLMMVTLLLVSPRVLLPLHYALGFTA